MIPERLKMLYNIKLGLFGWYLGLTMDIMVACSLSFLYDSESRFKSMVVITLFASSFLSQIAIGIRILFYGPRRLLGPDYANMSAKSTFLIKTIFVILCPVAPAIMLYIDIRRKRSIRCEEKKLEQMFG